MDDFFIKARLRRVMTTVVLAFLILNAYFLWWSYKNSLDQAERGSLMRLAGIANTLALQIDGDQHEKLMARFAQKDDVSSIGQDSIYEQIHTILRRNFVANMLKTPIYSIIIDENGKSIFGVTSAETPYFRHEYHSAPALLIEKHTEGAMIPMYQDEFGTWLSAFASIRNRKNQVVGVVQADQKFDEFLSQARGQIWKNLWVSLLVFAVFLFILVQILQPILKKEQDDFGALAAANFENITMRGQLEVSLEKLTNLDNFRKEMIANLSHDLRTPMSSILGYLETVLTKKEQLSNDEKNRFLNVAFSESKRLNRLVTELFELSKLESGQIYLDLEPFSIAELALDTLQKYRLTAESMQVQLLTAISNDLPLVFADIKWIDRVLQNLLDNAIRFAGAGGFVKFTISENAEKLHFKICNSGNPIPAAHLDRVFDRYFTAANRGAESTGLGLAIIKKIMDLHAENVVAEVNEGITTFRFTLAIYEK